MIVTSDEFIKEVSKIKPDQWKLITNNLKTVKEFLDVDSSVFRDMKDNIVTSLILKSNELLAPLKNELNELINTLLKPIMPYLKDIVGGLAVVIEWVAERIQDIIDFLAPTAALGMDRSLYDRWVSETGGGGFLAFLIWSRAQQAGGSQRAMVSSGEVEIDWYRTGGLQEY